MKKRGLHARGFDSKLEMTDWNEKKLTENPNLLSKKHRRRRPVRLR